MDTKIVIYILNVLVISILVAILEIIIEKDKGWGAGLPKDKWYGMIIGKNNPLIKNISSIVGIPHFFGYMIFMYLFLIPLLLILEYIFFIRDSYLVLAIYFAILATEDFSWFVLNWNFNSLEELLKGPRGNIWWHKRWIKISKNYYLPASYFIAMPLSLILLIISYEF